MADTVLKIRPLNDSPNLSAKIYDELKSAIMKMNIYDDEAKLRLDERGLSERFGISRTPMREALTRLDQEGLVTIVPRRGIYIVRKTKREILEMITVWAALESMAARLACEVASDGDIAKLHDLVDTYDRDHVHQHMVEYSDANIRFHESIIKLSGCDLISQMTDTLFMHVRAIRQRTIFEKDRARKSVDDHSKIVKALERRNADLASELVREHTMRLHDHVLKHVELD